MPNRAARALRQASTDAEIRLWAALRRRRLQAFKFRRQHSIGRFVVDFACTRHHLVIEADGGQHADREADAERTKWLERQGWRIRRFWNNDILANTEGVLETIPEALCASQPLTRLAALATLSRTAGEGITCHHPIGSIICTQIHSDPTPNAAERVDIV